MYRFYCAFTSYHVYLLVLVKNKKMSNQLKMDKNIKFESIQHTTFKDKIRRFFKRSVSFCIRGGRNKNSADLICKYHFQYNSNFIIYPIILVEGCIMWLTNVTTKNIFKTSNRGSESRPVGRFYPFFKYINLLNDLYSAIKCCSLY